MGWLCAQAVGGEDVLYTVILVLSVLIHWRLPLFLCFNCNFLICIHLGKLDHLSKPV